MGTHQAMKSDIPTKARNRVQSGRASRRQANHKRQNQPWYGTLSTLQLPCPDCGFLHKWNKPC